MLVTAVIPLVCAACLGTSQSIPRSAAEADGKAEASAVVDREAGPEGCVEYVQVVFQPLTPEDQATLTAKATAMAPAQGWLMDGGPWVGNQFWLGDRSSAVKAWSAEEFGTSWVVAPSPKGPAAFELHETKLGEFSLWSRGDRYQFCSD